MTSDVTVKDRRALEPPLPCAPLRGYLTRETSDEIWVQDSEATWLVAKADIVSTSEWRGAGDGGEQFKGKPVLLLLKDGATIYEMRPTRIKFRGRPITMQTAGDVPPVKGDADLDALAEGWLRHLGFGPQDTAIRAQRRVGSDRTACCWATSEGAVCMVDDCGWVDV